MRCSIFLFVLLSILFIGCAEDTLPKPKALLSLNYPKAKYTAVNSPCDYSFQNNTIGKVLFQENCNAVIQYPKLNGTLFLTYRTVNNNINSLLQDAQKLTYEHTRKADNILEEKYVNDQNRVFGMFYDVSGNAASQSQFYVTDSTKHFITGSIYFNAKPNYDSIFPAAAYLKNDIRHLMETISWGE